MSCRSLTVGATGNNIASKKLAMYNLFITTMALQSKLFASARAVPRNLAYFSSGRIGHAVATPRSVLSSYKYSTATPPTPAGPVPAKPAPATEPAAGSLDAILPDVLGSDGATDWSRSYHGLSASPFAPEIAEVLLAPIDPMDVEMKPGGPTATPALQSSY